MKKLRFKNRGGILYFGVDGKFKSSKLKYTNINKNIITNKFKSGSLDAELGFHNSNNAPTVEELLNDVMDSKSKVLKHKTMLAYGVACRTNIIPYFKGMLVSQVKPIDIKKFQDSIVEKDLGKGSVNLSRVLLKEVFALAVINEWCTLNPVKMIEMPKFRTKRKKANPFTLDEIDSILNNMSGAVKNFFGISVFSGMRSGELLALKWEDIDFNTDTISISNTIASGYINEAKTQSSIRDIEIIPQARKFLEAQRLETGLVNSFIFLDRNYNHYGSNTYFYHKFQSVMKKLNISKRSLHTTRHTFASMMLNNGIDPMWVSNTLGHESLDVTLKIYAHYMPKKEKMTIGFLEKRYKSGTNT